MDIYVVDFRLGVKKDFRDWLPPVTPKANLVDPAKIERDIAEKMDKQLIEAENGVLTGTIVSATMVHLGKGSVFTDLAGAALMDALMEELFDFSSEDAESFTAMVFGYNIRVRMRQLVADRISSGCAISTRFLDAVNGVSPVEFWDPRKYLLGTDTIDIATFRRFWDESPITNEGPYKHPGFVFAGALMRNIAKFVSTED